MYSESLYVQFSHFTSHAGNVGTFGRLPAPIRSRDTISPSNRDPRHIVPPLIKRLWSFSTPRGGTIIVFTDNRCSDSLRVWVRFVTELLTWCVRVREKINPYLNIVLHTDNCGEKKTFLILTNRDSFLCLSILFRALRLVYSSSPHRSNKSFAFY